MTTVEDIALANNFLYDFHTEDGPRNGELARKSMRKRSKLAKLLRNNSHICYVSNINVLFKAYSSRLRDQFIIRSGIRVTFDDLKRKS